MALKTIGSCIYALGSDGVIPAYTLTHAKDAKLRESWYRDAIFADPELVIGVCKSAGLVLDSETWLPWAKEFGTDSGSLDVLLVSSSGRIGIVETKLSFNPERRREVVAQVLDYAVALQEMPADDLPPLPAGAPTGLDVEIEERRRGGNFLLIIAGDQIEPRAIRLGERLFGGHLASEWDLAMIDLNLYVHRSDSSLGHLLVPELRGTLIHETRQVVRVLVEGREPEAKIQVERIPDLEHAGRTTWTAERFDTALAAASVSKEFRALIPRIRDFARQHSRASVTYGTGALGSITLSYDGASVLSLYLDGRAETKPGKYVERALGPDGATKYQQVVARVWGDEFTDGWRKPSAEQTQRNGAAVLDEIEAIIRTIETKRPR
jgi:hypothetical protein